MRAADAWDQRGSEREKEQCVQPGVGARAGRAGCAEQDGALEKEKGRGVWLARRAGEARKGKEEEGRANSWDWAKKVGRKMFFPNQILFYL